MRKILVVGLTAVASLLVLSLEARAQGSIAGAVKDPSGAVLPGVTVEAASPALIEQTRTAVTDSNGNYRIVDLPPGSYSVTFTLTGFKTVRREGIVIQGAFNAPVSPELQVGALEETITVSGTPTVDVSNNTAQFVVDRDILDAIPTPIRNTPLRALLLPGTAVAPFVLGQYNMSVHGSNTADTVIAIDGMRVNNLCGSGQFSGFYMNDAAIEEVTFTTGAESAEMQNGGLRINSTPKDGGNTVLRHFLRLRRGQRPAGRQPHRCDEGGTDGDRAAGDRLHMADQPVVRRADHARTSCGSTSPISTRTTRTTSRARTFADGSRAFRQSQGNYSAVTRLTWPASSRDKIRFYLDRQFNGEDYNGFNTLPTTTPEASTDAFGLGWVPQIKWTQTTTNKLLLEAGLSYYTQDYEQSCRPEVGPRDLPRLEQTTNRLSVACGNTIPPYTSWTKTYSGSASASYITGSHAFKAGMTMQWGTNSRTFSSNAQINTLVFNAGLLGLRPAPPTPCRASRLPCPIAVVGAKRAGRGSSRRSRRPRLLRAGHVDHRSADAEHGRRATTSSTPRFRRSRRPPQVWIQARNFAAIPNVPELERLVGASRRRLRPVRHRQDRAQGQRQQVHRRRGRRLRAELQPHDLFHADARAWIDFDGNKSILDAAGNIQFNEVIGGTSNFGQITNRPDPDLQRGYNWEYSASVQHELMERVSVTRRLSTAGSSTTSTSSTT